MEIPVTIAEEVDAWNHIINSDTSTNIGVEKVKTIYGRCNLPKKQK